MVKKLILVVVLTMVASMVSSMAAVAQSQDVYQVNYFANRNNPTGFDQIVNITNPGLQGSPMSATEGVLCANIYVFAADQQMSECCSCPITADGLLTLSLNNNLTGNPLTSVSPGSGVVKLISSAHSGTCDPTAIAGNLLTGTLNSDSITSGSGYIEPDLRAWGTHLVQTTPGTLFTTETEFKKAPLCSDEAEFLPYTCRFVQYLGSGKGICSCGSVVE
jgi:hypothetical protein